MRLVFALFGVVATVLLTVAMLFTAGWGHPPIVGTQIGFRGTGMDQVTTSAAVEQLEALNAMPDQIPKASPDGPRATDVYKNVQVLTDLSVDQFNTLMAAMTTWVAPQQGCAYCHNTENLADDSVYAKKVARRMIQMTRHINQDWKPHVQTTASSATRATAATPFRRTSGTRIRAGRMPAGSPRRTTASAIRTPRTARRAFSRIPIRRSSIRTATFASRR